MKSPRWTVPRLWPGATVAVIGGGPSLRVEDLEAVRAAGLRAIAVNTAFKLAPFADLLYFCDEEWIKQWRGDADFLAFAGLKVALQNARTWELRPELAKSILVVENYGGPENGQHGLCEIPDGVNTGRSSGYQAVELAWKLGARRALLLGFDMRAVGSRTHWHSGTVLAHQRQTEPKDYAKAMIPPWEALKRDLDARGFELLNCTPGSALEPTIQFTPFCEALARVEAERAAESAARAKAAAAEYTFAVAGH